MHVSWRKIRELIKTVPDPFVLAVSGGIDSVFMLDFVSRCKVRYVVAHFNHKLRPESEAEQAFVKSLAERHGVAFYVGYGDNIKGSSQGVEAEARDQRYAFLRGVSGEVGGSYIMTAHHQDDQVENVILRLMRGLPHTALTMQMFNENDEIFRPFLDVAKEQIIKQAQSRGLTWMEDLSNLDQAFDRNWVRHKIIPLMMERRNIKKSIITGINAGRPQQR